MDSSSKSRTQSSAQPSKKRNRRDNKKPGPTKKQPMRTSPECLPGEASTRERAPNPVLVWERRYPYVPLQSEEAMLPVLLPRKEKERRMISKQPYSRLREIRDHLRKEAPGLSIMQALSLRRHHIKLLNPYRSMTQLGLGDVNDIQEAAEKFERVTEAYLKEKRIDFWNEQEQKKRMQVKLTPDFLLRQPVLLKTYEAGSHSFKHMDDLEGTVIHWIEVKMFYGASTIPAETKNAIGTILPKARKYVEAFGPGAILFMYGCGDRLAAELFAIGVTAICASPIPGRLMKQVHEHQKTWCARDGKILP